MPTQARPRGWFYKPGSSIIRGYDSSALFREDCLERIKHLQAVDACMNKTKETEKEHTAEDNSTVDD